MLIYKMLFSPEKNWRRFAFGCISYRLAVEAVGCRLRDDDTIQSPRPHQLQ